MNSLAARKQALVAESEVYRQALAADLQGLQTSATRLTRNLRFLRLLKPILLIAPLIGSIVGMRSAPPPEKRRATGWRKWWGTALVGWRLYRRISPVISHFASKRTSRARRRQPARELTP
jgi:hypothetical protein